MSRITPEIVLKTLRDNHCGQHNGVHVKSLAAEILMTAPTSLDERHIRYAVLELRKQGRPICGHPQSGYFYAVDSSEVDATCEFLYSRAMTTLSQVAHLKRRAIPDIRGQLGLKHLERPAHKGHH